MYSYQDDVLNSYRVINDMETYDQLNMFDLNFMPNYEVKLTRQDYTANVTEVLHENENGHVEDFNRALHVDLDKMSKFIQFKTQI